MLNISQSELWVNCPFMMSRLFNTYSPKSTRNVDKNESGSVAHRIAELSILSQLRSLNKAENDEIDELCKLIPRETLREVYEYVEYVMSKKQSQNDVIKIEEDVIIKSLNISGRIDCYILNEEKSRIEVIDFKTGKGIKVEPDGLQMVLYATLLSFRYPKVNTYELTIFQKSNGGPRSITIRRSDLQTMGWRDTVDAINAFPSMTSFPRRAGKWCEHSMCPFRDKCTSYYCDSAKKALSILEDSHGCISDISLSGVSELMDALITLQKAKEALSNEICNRFSVGEDVPNYKMLAGKRIKKIEDAKAVVDELVELIKSENISIEDVFDLKSPVQLEKSLPKDIYDEIVRDNIKVELTKPTLKKI